MPDVPDAVLPALFRGAALSDLPTREQIAGITVPTTVLAWIGDPAHPVSTASTLVELLVNATLEVAHTPEDVARWPGILSQDVQKARLAAG